ncbi:MAG: Na-K-Cl cotransporter, partial [Candidatus Heimdallarchaeota archaeon]|nr:Na-K-Cl cotransporter [Candidatus Heimdallarchaeota archaeon]
MSFSLESWASSDFRPSFKIHRLIGWVGFIACFMVMFQIDMVSMFFALILIFGIYFYLKRRKLQLDYGDVWQSVYSTIVRKALTKMESGNMEKRNWRPNIILFSGGSNSRPYLIKLGKSLLGRHGLLSNFELKESPSSKVLFSKHEQALSNDDDKYEGVFTRRQACRDIYEGIETIAGTYGFSGIEPNTVLMGWVRQTKDPARFGQMMGTLQDLDLSVLMVDYDDEAGFGKKKQIDLWWRGAGNNGNMALSLIRFLKESDEWHNAKVRLLIVNPKNEESDSILSKTERILESFRVDAEIRVINNKIENDSFETVIRRESAESDLTILGIP